MSDKATAEMIYYAEIMRQLADSQRFKDWFYCNFRLDKLVDEDAKEIEYRLIELPPEVVAERMMELAKTMELEAPKVELASPDVLRQLNKKGRKV